MNMQDNMKSAQDKPGNTCEPKAPKTQRVIGTPTTPPRPVQGGGRPHSWFTASYTAGNVPQSTAQRHWQKYLEFAGLHGIHSPDHCQAHEDTFVAWLIATADIAIQATKHRALMKSLTKAGASDRAQAKAKTNAEAQARILAGDLEQVRNDARAVVSAAHDAWTQTMKDIQARRAAQ